MARRSSSTRAATRQRSGSCSPARAGRALAFSSPTGTGTISWGSPISRKAPRRLCTWQMASGRCSRARTPTRRPGSCSAPIHRTCSSREGRRSRSRGSRSRLSPCPGIRRRTSRTTPTRACSRATCSLPGRWAEPTFRARIGTPCSPRSARFSMPIRRRPWSIRGMARRPRWVTSSRGTRSWPSSARS